MVDSHSPVGIEQGEDCEDGHREEHVLPVLLSEQLQLLLWEEKDGNKTEH